MEHPFTLCYTFLYMNAFRNLNGLVSQRNAYSIVKKYSTVFINDMYNKTDQIDIKDIMFSIKSHFTFHC